MSDWTAGYVADVEYTFGYYPELNPLRVRLAFANAGLATPEFGTACELGFGQGVSSNIHAAATLTTWYGTDFNPSQASFAQDMASASKSDIKLYDQAFAEFCERDDLPDFDFIGLHGIWSWISDENRRVIVEFVRRKLKVGGVLYISYNTLPGWAPMVPLRHMLTQHAEVMAASGSGIIPRIDAALAFADRLFSTNPAFAKAAPGLDGKLATMKTQNRHYLAHEYFNLDWRPMHFADVAECIKSAKLTYACSAYFLDHIENANLTTEQQTLLREISDPTFRQTVRDLIVNQQFRRDYWVKGARHLNRWDRSELLRAERVVLITPRQDVAMKTTGVLGEASLSEVIYLPLLDALADHRPKSLGQIEQGLRERGISLDQIVQSILVLMAKNDVASANEDKIISKARAQTDRLNQKIQKLAVGSTDITCLACPVTGGAVPVTRIQQMAILAAKEGKKTPADWSQAIWQALKAQGQNLVKAGVALQGDDENLAELLDQMEEFQRKRLPMLKALQVA